MERNKNRRPTPGNGNQNPRRNVVMNMSRDMTKAKNDCAPSEDSDQPGHPPWASAQSDQSLRCPHEESLVLSYPLSAQRRL